ncbi:Gfo/Idh/MocA family protein [Methylocapsa sp. S129]|uniref:Gfo/Idh/MocA family protein n=1 Tax=Methylocapsa sp. S129 TaxID=1641869 RepID=UPI00131CB2C9|nr:Gfo/Idh/MocA family oxidoreductase [Methylocapsa sp. S129]
MRPVKLAVLGAGMIGKRHAELIADEPSATLSAIVDPSPVGRQVAEQLGVPWFASFADLVNADRPDGIIIATPNQLHVQHGLKAVGAGVPAIVEKPIAADVATGEALVSTAEKAGVPLLVGHHRRYNPMIQKAKQIIDSGRLGRVVTVHAAFWLIKPEDYFVPDWRRTKGAGPILLNLIHDVDLLRYLCGEIVSVQAQESSAIRGHAVEDSAVILLRFANGALGTINASDCVVAPWSWELTTGENPAYPRQDQSCYQIGGTDGALSIPQLEIWSNPGKRGWWEPLIREQAPFVPEDPLKVQIRHFCAVIRGEASPIVPGREGLNTLKVIEAVKESARTGAMIKIA